MSIDNEVLGEIVNIIADEIYKYLMRRLPERLLEDVVIDVGFDTNSYTLEISIDVMTNPLMENLDGIINSAVEFGFKIADYLIGKFRRGELVGLPAGEIERIAEEYAKSLRNNT
ncbi:DUF3194 domain-containing protein [Vulcanisaeta sp. JCM 16159]|uniref:DUF3194 domain-containing protein n=1 Tax=Vulcanisaeta sp. JCM 16159 TaxID=1295371 RepID=UPI0006D05C13|nr:DUF3194 domain-containing protein [Vulcanisaeta sp. JCM 16159]